MMRRGRGRAGRPGVVGTMARTAVIAGTATAASGKVAQKQHASAQQAADAQAFRQQQAAPPPVEQPPPAAAPAASTPDTGELIAQLQQLAALKDQGILTEEEFQTQKARLLG